MRYRNPVLAEADHEADLRADRREFWQLLLFVGLLQALCMSIALRRTTAPHHSSHEC